MTNALLKLQAAAIKESSNVESGDHSLIDAMEGMLAHAIELGLPNNENTLHVIREGLQGREALPTTSPRLKVVKASIAWMDMTGWDDQPVPEREWAVHDRIPLRQVTLLSGEGAAGKSLLELMLSAAHVLSKDWLGTVPEPGRAFYLGAEDDDREIRIRLHSVLEHYGASYADLVAGGFRAVSLCEGDAILGAPNKSGIIEPTKLYQQLYEQAGDLKPKHIGLDSSADVFAGNEIDRSQTRQFVALLRKLAIVANGSVVLLSHPSLTGINSGSGLSGSTAWHNSVRARMYMTTPKAEPGEQPNTDLRELAFKKNQYGPVSGSIALQWQRGVFVPVGGMSTIEKAAYEANAEEAFLAVMRKMLGRGVDLSPAHTSHSYAPTVASREPEAKGLTKRALADTMERLLNAGRVPSQEWLELKVA